MYCKNTISFGLDLQGFRNLAGISIY